MGKRLTNDPELRRLFKGAATPWVVATVPGSDKVAICSSRNRQTVARDLEPDAAELIVAAVDRFDELMDWTYARRFVDAAKAKLMHEEGWSEPEAYSFVQRRAMDGRVSMKAVAEQVLTDEFSAAAGPNGAVPQAMLGTVVDVMLILTRGDEVLLAERRDTGYCDGWLNLPSGKLEGGEDVYQGVIREASEEIGLRIDRDELTVSGVVSCLNPEGQARLGVFFHSDYDPDRQGEPTNAEPHKCAGVSWHRMDELPDSVVPYNAAGIGLYLNGEMFGEIGWDKPAW